METKWTVGLMGILLVGCVSQYFFPRPDVKTITKLKEITTKYEESQKKVQEYQTKITESETQIKTLTNWSKLDQTQYELKEKINVDYFENGNVKSKKEARIISKKTSTQVDSTQYVEMSKYESAKTQITTLTEENTQLKLKVDKLNTTVTTSVVRNRLFALRYMDNRELEASVGYTVFKDIAIEGTLGMDLRNMGLNKGIGVVIRF